MQTNSATSPAGSGYNTIAMSLHWIMALLIFAGWGLGLYMTDLHLSPEKLRYYSWHKWLGVSVFGLALLRVSWLALHGAPAPLRSCPVWQRQAARISHVLLYVFMFILPLSGWLMSSARGVSTVYFGVLPLPDLIGKNKELGNSLAEIHEILAYSLAMVVTIHIGAALKHQFIDRDGLMWRMLPGRRR